MRKYQYGCAAKKYLNSTILTAVDDWHNYGHIAAYGLNHNR
ncbi:hypothetical protein [[Phormidium] sp. ETS-05]|nr:hypothetical protein [[Phormidium] sp. ETS-05]